MPNRTDLSNLSLVDLSTEEDQKTTKIKEHYHSRDSGIEEGKFKILGGEGQAKLAITEDELEDFQFISLEIDTCESIEFDFDEIQIAGFSKQKLLNMCNFCKISYGNNDEKLDSRYKTKAELINEGYSIISFYYNWKNKKCAGFVFTKDKEITITYRGTKDFDDLMTDVNTAFTSKFLPESGKMHDGFHNAFYDSLPSLGKILNNYSEKQGLEIKDFKINCTGHSMGGALATITALYLKKVKDAEYVRIATLGSPRVSDFRGAEIYEKLFGENTIRVTNLSDPISMFPSGSMGFKHVGKSLKIKTGNFIINCFGISFCIMRKYYHKTDTYYRCIQNIKPEDFQSNNSVSRYYYLSYVAAVPYYITTITLAIPYYLFLSAISNTRQRYFEREIELTNGGRLMSLNNNRNEPVIQKLSSTISSSKSSLIIPIDCSINGRGEGLKFNIYNIDFFIKNNDHLNRNNMRLRQLYETKDIPVKVVSDLISTGNHASGNRNTISNLVNKLATLSLIVNKEGSKQLQNHKAKSVSSQQPQKNALDKGKNIMNNRHALKKYPVSNNCKGGKMNNDNKNKSTKEKLSNAIKNSDPGMLELLLNQEGINITESIFKEALDQARAKTRNWKESDKQKQSQKNRLIKIIELLEAKYKSIGGAAPSVDDSATTGSQVALTAKSKESENDQQGLLSLSSQSSVIENSSNSSNFFNVATSDEGSTYTNNGKHSQTPDSKNETLLFKKIDEELMMVTTNSENSSSECIEVSSIENLTNDEVFLLDRENSTLEGDSNLQQDTQPKTLVTSGRTGNVITESDQSEPELISDSTSTSIQEPTLSSTSKKSEQVNNTSPPNTKSSKLRIIAASGLAVAVAILELTIAVHFGMLAVGIVVGAFCLVATYAVIYCCSPQSSVKESEIEKVSYKEKELISV